MNRMLGSEIYATVLIGGQPCLVLQSSPVAQGLYIQLYSHSTVIDEESRTSKRMYAR
jgi:hypothetical protein